jgi:hypothetical protein
MQREHGVQPSHDACASRHGSHVVSAPPPATLYRRSHSLPRRMQRLQGAPPSQKTRDVAHAAHALSGIGPRISASAAAAATAADNGACPPAYTDAPAAGGGAAAAADADADAAAGAAAGDAKAAAPSEAAPKAKAGAWPDETGPPAIAASPAALDAALWAIAAAKGVREDIVRGVRTRASERKWVVNGIGNAVSRVSIARALGGKCVKNVRTPHRCPRSAKL